MKTKGIKHDQDKPRMDLLDSYALTEIAKVMTFGAQKYEDNNWRRGFKWSRLIAATLRHCFAWLSGEDKDSETGLSHLAHAGCCIMMLLWHEEQRKDLDDRHKTTKRQPEEPMQYWTGREWSPDGYGGYKLESKCKECKCHEK